MPYTVSPKTYRPIKVGGPTYTELMKSPKYAKQLMLAPISPTKKIRTVIVAKKEKKEKTYVKASSKSHGCSRQKRHMKEGLSSSEFCGPAGGSCPFTFPVNTPRRVVSAMSYARFAPNPAGVRKCAMKKAEERGWIKNGKIKVGSRK